MEQEQPHFLVTHVSLGDVLVLVSSLIVFAFGGLSIIGAMLAGLALWAVPGISLFG